MRWIALAVLFGCGGTGPEVGACLTDKASDLTAVRTSFDPGCENQPASIAVRVDPIAWVFTEDGTAHAAQKAGLYTSGCSALATWYAADGSYWHNYSLGVGGNRLDVLVRNSCTAHYELR